MIDNVSLISDVQLSSTTASSSSPSPLPDHPQPIQRSSKDENVLSASPLCSSLLLELPPSPISTSNSAPPPPPPICTTPPLSARSRKRRSEAPTFDPADWLESLSSGLQPLTPPVAPFLESDFGLESDLNVNRVLDLMVEQW